MSRSLRRTIHILYEEASMKGKKINSCEHFYIEYVFKRNMNAPHTMIEPYAKDKAVEFEKELRASHRNPNNQDSFYIVFDTDFDDAQSNIQQVITRIIQLHKRYPSAKIILSSRSFECWLCMYNRDIYNKPYSSQEQLEKDVTLGAHCTAYKKGKDWYSKHATLLHDLYEDAKRTNWKSRRSVFASSKSNVPTELSNHLAFPDFSNQAHISFLVRLSPISYFDVLVDDILRTP